MTSAVPDEASVPSRSHWLVLGRTIWACVTLLVAGLFMAAISARYDQLLLVSPQADTTSGQLTPPAMFVLTQLGLSREFYAAYIVALEIVIGVVFAVVGGVIAWQRADERTALFVSLMLTTLGLVGTPLILVLREQHGA